ncbi:MAG: acetolactate synthase small subunit [Candidatus Hydrogenedentota bacterium]
MKHTISVLVENHFGVLAKISGLFSGRGFNIDSLTVGETDDPTVSRMTIVVSGDDRILEQVCKQLNKLIDVIKVIDFKDSPAACRELLLVKVSVSEPVKRVELLDYIRIFDAKVIDLNDKTFLIEVTGDTERIDSFINTMKGFGIKEIARTGVVALGKVQKSG